ncbi:MAG: hypothetical protein AAGD07_05235 [Planctomycetota bacterium]
MPALGLALLITMVVGCGTDQPTSMMDGVDQEALQSYEEMVAAEEARMTQADAADE